MSTLTEIQQLVNSGFTTDVILNGIKGHKIGGVLFLPYSGYWPQSNINGYIEMELKVIKLVECYFYPIAVIGRNLTSTVILKVENGDSIGLLRVQQ